MRKYRLIAISALVIFSCQQVTYDWGQLSNRKLRPRRELSPACLRPVAAKNRPEFKNDLIARFKIFRGNPLIEQLEKTGHIFFEQGGEKIPLRLEIEDWLPGFIAITVYPSQEDRKKFSELEILDMEVDDAMVPPSGSLGWIKIDLIKINEDVCLLIDEVHSGRGYRQLEKTTFHNKALRERFQYWREAALGHIIESAKLVGIEHFYATTPQRAKRLCSGLLQGETRRNYQIPFRARWHKEMISFRFLLTNYSESVLLWKYDPPAGPRQYEQIKLIPETDI